MPTPDDFSTYFTDLLKGTYDCVDRISVRGYFVRKNSVPRSKPPKGETRIARIRTNEFCRPRITQSGSAATEVQPAKQANERQ
jgi:hypothetical protein